MAKDYNSYSFRNRDVDNIQSRSNTANDPKKKKKKRTTNSNGNVIKRRTKLSGDVVIKTIKKPKRVKSDPTPKPPVQKEKRKKDNRTKEQKKSDKELQKKLYAESMSLIDDSKTKVKYASPQKVKKDKRSVDKVVIKAEDNSSQKPKGKYKPIKRGIQINRSKTGGGGKRRYNNPIQKGKGFFGKNKRIK